MIVVDTNIIAYLFIEGDRTEIARAVHRVDSDWIAPNYWRHEFLNVLSTYARYRAMSLEEVEEIWHEALSFGSLTEHETNMPLALELSIANNISVYDAEFVALAQTLNLPLVTEDRRLIAAFPSIAASMETFLAQ